MFKSTIFAGVSILALASTAMAKDTLPAHPMFKVQPGLRPNIHQPTALPTWDFKWKYSGTSYTAIFVGTDPSKGAVSTSVPVEIIPVIMKVGSTVENPSAGKAKSPISRTVASPIFDATTDYKQGKTDLGATQYEDAFQRGALWGVGVSGTDYHVLLGTPTILKPLHLTGQSVGTEFGVKVILASIDGFDNSIQATVKKQPVDSLPIFVTTNTYLTTGGECCIGGYHSYTGTQAYSMFTYIKATGVFSQDVSALSHEIGEWLDDPLTDNRVKCGIYEVGDPLEGGQPGHPYGTWAYKLGGFTYHLQDLVLPPYFGAPTSTSVNGWSTFQGYTIGVCSNGG